MRTVCDNSIGVDGYPEQEKRPLYAAISSTYVFTYRLGRTKVTNYITDVGQINMACGISVASLILIVWRLTRAFVVTASLATAVAKTQS